MSGSRRLVLVDFDWDDAALLPALLHQPGVSVGLVAGQGPEDPGVRLAELCELPRTLDLADLTRELFALALVSERSPRRSHVQSLLRAMGTPSQTPAAFLGEPEDGESEPAAFDIDDALRLQAAVLDDALGELDGTGWASAEPAEIRSEPEPALPEAAPCYRRGWLATSEFLRRVEHAVVRHAASGHPLALERLDLPRESVAGDRFAERLPDRVRETDVLCQPSPFRILLLTGASHERFAFLRARLRTRWEEAWLATEGSRPAPELHEHRVELTRADEASAFVARARVWLECSTS
jgi:hypothetical protein